MQLVAFLLLQWTPALCCFSVMLHNVWHLGGGAWPLGPLNPPLVFSARRNVQETGRDGEGYLEGCFMVRLYSGLWIHGQNLLSSHCRLSIMRQVHGLCLGLTGRLSEKPDISLHFFPHSLPYPHSRPLPYPPLPPLRSRPVKSS